MAQPSLPKPKQAPADLRHNPDLDAAFNPQPPAETPKQPTTPPAGKPQAAAKPGQSPEAKQQAQKYKDLAAQHARAGKLAGLRGDKAGATRGRMLAAEYRRVAGFHSLGEHDEAERARRKAERVFGVPTTATPPALPQRPQPRAGGDPFAEHKPGTQDVNQRVATPPPLPTQRGPSPAGSPQEHPHQRSQAAAVSTANELARAMQSGDPKAINYARDRFESALKVHQKRGFEAIDRMAREKYGSGFRASRAAQKAKAAFVAKLEAARQRVGAQAFKGFGLGLDLDPLPEVFPWMVTKSSDAGGRWITIGGEKGADGKRHGGSPVFIKGGRIVKGHPSLVGKDVGNLKGEAEHGGHRQQLAQSRDYDVAVWRKKARKAGHDPKHLDELAAQIKAHHDAFANERKDVVRHAREYSKKNDFADLRQINANARHGGDWTKIRGFDNTAESTANAFPHHFHEETGQHGSVEDQLYDMLTAGDPSPMSHGEAYEQAFEQLGEPVPKKKRERAPATDADPFSFDFGANEKGVRLPFIVHKQRDASGHEHATDGRFGSVAGSHPSRTTANGKPVTPNRNPSGKHADPDEKAAGLAKRVREVPRQMRHQVTSFVRGRYRRLAKRYGPKGALAILGATVLLLPTPLPGSSLIPIAVAEAVLAIRRAVAKGHEMELDEATIQREAKALLADLMAHMGES